MGTVQEYPWPEVTVIWTYSKIYFFYIYQYKKLQYNATFYYTLITIQYYKELYHEEQKTMSTPWQHIKTYNSTK